MSDRYEKPARGSYRDTWDVVLNQNFDDIGDDIDHIEATKGIFNQTTPTYQFPTDQSSTVPGETMHDLYRAIYNRDDQPEVAGIELVNYNDAGSGWYADTERYRTGLRFLVRDGNNGLVEALDIDNKGNLTVAGSVSAGSGAGREADVTRYGAAGDGTTDDTSAILQAINSGSNSVYMPAGTYNISSTIDFEGVDLYGDGMGETIISVQSTMSHALETLTAGASVADLTIDCNSSAHEGLHLEADNTFAHRVEVGDPSQYGSTTSTVACIAAFSSQGAHIHQCRVSGARAPNSGVSRGILVDGSSGGQVCVSECSVRDIQPTDDGDGIVVQSGNPRSRVINNTVTEAAKSAIKINLGAESTTVVGNTLHTSPPGLSVMRIQASGTAFVGNSIIQPNVGGELVRVSDGADNVTVAGNTLELTAADTSCEAIRVRDTESNVSITGNAINMNDTGRHAIQVDASTGISIADNTILNPGQRGITLEGPIGCTVTGNTINGAGAHGINIGSGSRIAVTGNSIDSTFEAVRDLSSEASIGTNAT